MKELTEQERKYLEYWIKYEEERPIKITILVGRIAIGLYVLLWVVEILFFDISVPKITDYLEIFGMVGFPLGMSLAFAGFGRLFQKRFKELYISDYEIYRTKISNTDVEYIRNSKGVSTRIYYYHCQGIRGQVVPVSQKLYKKAKRNDDVTVVKIKSRNILLGITFDEEFERVYFK